MTSPPLLSMAAAVLLLLFPIAWLALRASRSLLAVGAAAPGFALPDDAGREVRLADFRGRQGVVLVFYPGDGTPVCTRQLCDLRDSLGALQARGIAVLGINGWSAESHRRFREKHALPFPLLVDRQGKMQKAYHAHLPGMVRRTVYGIDREGRIVFARRGRPPVETILAAFGPASQERPEV